MSNTTYYLVWLAAGLIAVAALSAAITLHLRTRVVRRMRAAQLVDALEAYSAWIAEQRQAAFFQGEGPDGDTPLRDVRQIQRTWFPELSEETAQLLEVHARLIDFLWSQHVLKLEDAEAWIESDQDVRFAQLWRLHRAAAQAAADRLRGLSGGTAATGVAAGSIFPA